MASFTIDELLEATGGELITRGKKKLITGVSTDSRSMTPDSIFLALQGESFDGHNYISQAVAGGAAALVVQEEVSAPQEVSVVKVPNTLVDLGNIARFHRRRFSLPVVAVTGSNGKTTTKELLSAVLTQRYRVVKTKFNYNNEVGLPLTLLEINESTEAVVVEMGMRGKGQIAYLAKIAEPTIGVITNVGVTHLELLGSKKAIADAKGELIAALPAAGQAILNGDDPLVRSMRNLFSGSSYFYGLRERELDLKAVEINAEKTAQKIKADGKWGRFCFSLPLPGKHNVENALAALTVGLSLGIPAAELSKAFINLPEMGKRLKIIKTGEITIIDDTYNASPPSVKAALNVLMSLPTAKRKIAVFGDMMELGKISKESHREIGASLDDYGCCALFALGPESEETVALATTKGVRAMHYQEKTDLLRDLLAYISAGDAILVKGSRGMKMEEIVTGLMKHLG